MEPTELRSRILKILQTMVSHAQIQDALLTMTAFS
jgi:hypothetical protein